MKNRYCINCGMPVPRKAKICPECGCSLKLPVPPLDKLQPDSPHPKRRSKPKINRKALFYAVGLILVFSVLVFLTPTVVTKIQFARSRHQENMLDEQRASTTTRPEFSIPEISMPEIAIPDIRLPEPPPAAFALESYEIKTNPEGETVLYVNVSYTNIAEDKQCFMINYKISVQQEGAECKITAGDPAKDNHLLDQLQPDETAVISEAFIIQAEKETTVSVSAYLGGEKYVKETMIPHTDGTVSASESNT